MKLYTIVSFDILAMQPGAFSRALMVHANCWRTRQEAEHALATMAQQALLDPPANRVPKQEWVSQICETELVIEGDDA